MELFWLYAALAASAFTSATILPGTSEAAFTAFVIRHPESWLGAWLVAGVCNAAGSILSYGMGRLLPDKRRPSEKIFQFLSRYGIWMLLLAWVPVVGDGLPLAAGWLRLNAWKCGLALTAGKLLRYGVLLGGIQAWGGAVFAA
ncbi:MULTISPECIES: YqaA family protein [unclassified Neisseria]|uniref:YqaA family protein n=1 Tax=unclassified Neisseria TaxID=2623750 RepID=UPI0010725024|nr:MULTISPECIES: DedA family protein [unclassified Neisseria]MBF0804377.1 DedA family protein [Neisseria sp. 19428wB4_WF04]TFU42857.1 DedA family protein [Neisseria sp. WF04]